MSEWYDDPDVQAWLDQVDDEMAPAMEDSRAVVSIFGGKTDAKLAVELGYAILLDKPIIGVVIPGTRVAEKLVRVCDEVVEVDPHDVEAIGQAVAAALQRIVQRSQRES